MRRRIVARRISGLVLQRLPGAVDAGVGRAHRGHVAGPLVRRRRCRTAPRACRAPRRPFGSPCGPSTRAGRRAARPRTRAVAQQRRGAHHDVGAGEQVAGHVGGPLDAGGRRRARPAPSRAAERSRCAAGGRRPGSRASPPARPRAASGSMSGCRKRLNRTSASAPASSRRSAISPIELKYGLSLIATGTVTAALTRSAAPRRGAARHRGRRSAGRRGGSRRSARSRRRRRPASRARSRSSLRASTR